jgi:formylglycine-generating enzyme required for sulfatase activity
MVRGLALDQVHPPANRPAYRFGGAARLEHVTLPPGATVLGAACDGVFGWDNEFPEHRVDVSAFGIDTTPVRNGDFLEFMEAGGFDRRALWTNEGWAWRVRQDVRHPPFWHREDGRWLYRALFDNIPLDHVLDWPVSVSWAAADAYTRWTKMRLPSEAELHRATYTTPDGGLVPYPWGDASARAEHGNFGFAHWSPTPVGCHPAGRSPWGLLDAVGNGWEWTRTAFAPFPGFEPMPNYPGYSADFFDGRHYVMLGASWATDTRLVRRSFRNWFQPHYPYVFAKFRRVSLA